MKTEIDLILIRHGKTQWNQSGLMQGFRDSALLEQSKKELKNLYLKCESHPVVFSSDLGRAMSSARYIANHYSATIITDRRLRERNFGIAEGKLIRSVYSYYQDKDIPVPKAESVNDVSSRIYSWLDYIKANYKDNTIILICHGEWARIFFNLIDDKDRMDNTDAIIPNATPIYKKISI